MDQKYNVGDKVLIVSRPVACVFNWVRDMDEYCGKEATIISHRWSTSHEAHLYEIDIDDQKFNWCENCFCGRVHEPIHICIKDINEAKTQLFAGV